MPRGEGTCSITIISTVLYEHVGTSKEVEFWGRCSIYGYSFPYQCANYAMLLAQFACFIANFLKVYCAVVRKDLLRVHAEFNQFGKTTRQSMQVCSKHPSGIGHARRNNSNPFSAVKGSKVRTYCLKYLLLNAWC